MPKQNNAYKKSWLARLKYADAAKGYSEEERSKAIGRARKASPASHHSIEIKGKLNSSQSL